MEKVIIPWKWVAKCETVRFSYETNIVRETEKAVLLRVKIVKETLPDGYWIKDGDTEERNPEFWMPKSQIEKVPEGIAIPDWLRRNLDEDIILLGDSDWEVEIIA